MATDQTALYALLQRMSAGDKEAFGAFYDATISQTFSVIMTITANKELAEEVASDVYIQVWRTAAHYDANKIAPMTWLMMIAKGRAIEALVLRKQATGNPPSPGTNSLTL